MGFLLIFPHDLLEEKLQGLLNSGSLFLYSTKSTISYSRSNWSSLYLRLWPMLNYFGIHCLQPRYSGVEMRPARVLRASMRGADPDEVEQPTRFER
jgi:hypothetical protein